MIQAQRRFDETLDSWDGNHAVAWRPKAGEKLVGTLLRYDKAASAYSDEPVIVAIVEEDQTSDQVAVWLTRAVLLSEFKRERPKPGEKLAIKYAGKHPEKDYHRYLLAVDRPQVQSADPDWDSVEDLAPGDDSF